MATPQTKPAPAASPLAPAKARRIKVRARRTGYANEQRYREGDVFLYTLTAKAAAIEIARRKASGENENDGLPAWLEPVAAATEEKVTTSQQSLNQELDTLRGDRAGSGDADVI